MLPPTNIDQKACLYNIKRLLAMTPKAIQLDEKTITIKITTIIHPLSDSKMELFSKPPKFL